jgi:hypothetical protein
MDTKLNTGVEESLISSDYSNSKVEKVMTNKLISGSLSDLNFPLSNEFEETIRTDFSETIDQISFEENKEPLSKTIRNDYSSAIDKKSINKTHKLLDHQDIFLGEGTYITGWRNTENRSSRIIEIYDQSILLECLIDKERKEYAEIEYKKTMFQDMELYIGKFLKLCFYERANQVMMEVIDNSKLIDENDFPKVELSKEFKNLILKKKK